MRWSPLSSAVLFLLCGLVRASQTFRAGWRHSGVGAGRLGIGRISQISGREPGVWDYLKELTSQLPGHQALPS